MIAKQPFGRTGHLSTRTIFGSAALWALHNEIRQGGREEVLIGGGFDDEVDRRGVRPQEGPGGSGVVDGVPHLEEAGASVRPRDLVLDRAVQGSVQIRGKVPGGALQQLLEGRLKGGSTEGCALWGCQGAGLSNDGGLRSGVCGVGGLRLPTRRERTSLSFGT